MSPRIGVRRARSSSEGYRAKRAEFPSIEFYFGKAQIDPDGTLIDENAALDLATFDLTPYCDSLKGIDRTSVVVPRTWPPGVVSAEDIIAFAGFPGSLRQEPAPAYLRFHSFSSGASPVVSVGENHLYTRIEIDECVTTVRRGLSVGPPGNAWVAGLSGGPVFAWRMGVLLSAELVGFVTEYQESLDLLYVRLARCIDSAGKLNG